jgi:hypothetical protein
MGALGAASLDDAVGRLGPHGLLTGAGEANLPGPLRVHCRDGTTPRDLRTLRHLRALHFRRQTKSREEAATRICLLTSLGDVRLRQSHRRCACEKQDAGCNRNPAPHLPHEPLPIPVPRPGCAGRGYLKLFGSVAKVFTKVMANEDTKNSLLLFLNTKILRYQVRLRFQLSCDLLLKLLIGAASRRQ